MQYVRTENPQSTFGPADGTGRTWHEYFSDQAALKPAALAAAAADLDDSDDEPYDEFAGVVVTVPAHEVEEGWPTSLNTWRKRAITNGWDLKMGHSVAEWPAVMFKDAERGVRFPGYEVQNWWMNAVRGSEYITICYELKDGKPNSARTLRTARSMPWKKLSDAELKEMME